MLWRHALLYPGSSCYYVAPTFTHGKELIWRDPRLAGFIGTLHDTYIDRTNSTDCTVYFKNGSFIKIIGSENFAAANGLRPSFLVYDEFCEFHPRFHETMNPNRIVRKCPLLIIGTPPMQDSQNREQYMSYAKECRKRKKGVHIQQSSYSNPHIDKEELDDEKIRLYDRGEGFIWESQYMAKIVPGGRNVIFPMFCDKHVHAHSDLVREISNDAHRLHWYCIADPGTTTTMAILFVALNPYTKQIYVMDELYLTDKEETSVGKVMPRIFQISGKLAPRVDFDEEWFKIYDEAAAWFCNEVAMQYDTYFMPTLKVHNKKEMGISLMKDIFIYNVVKVSDKCVNFKHEVTNYIADKDGKFPRTGDHLIDDFRYFLAASHYSFDEIQEAVRHLGPRKPQDLLNNVQSRNFDDLDEDWTGVFGETGFEE